MKLYVRKKVLYFVPEEDLVSGKLSDYRDKMLSKLNKSKNYNDIVVNMKSVNSIDSAGISLLIGLSKEIFPTDKTLTIVELDESLKQVFSTFNLNEQIEIKREETLS